MCCSAVQNLNRAAIVYIKNIVESFWYSCISRYLFASKLLHDKGFLDSCAFQKKRHFLVHNDMTYALINNWENL